MIRVFIAVDLSKEALKELGKFVDKLAAKRWPVRWETSDKLHITLFFIGWIEKKKTDSIKKAVEESVGGMDPFSIKMGKLGVFPDFVQPKIVWLGIKGEQPQLVYLQKRISVKMVEMDFEQEKRKWIPHLTIGRVKRETRFRAKKELGRQLRKLRIAEFSEVSIVNRLVVYESKLYPDGSEYRKLFEVKLT